MFRLFIAFLTIFPLASRAQAPYQNTTVTLPDGPHTIRNTALPAQYSFEHNPGAVKKDFRRDYILILKNDSVVHVVGKIDLKDSVHSITAKAKDRETVKYIPADTREIISVDEYSGRLKGFPADSCWLFKVITGKINGYAFLPNKATMIAIQLGKDGPIIPLTEANLMPLISTDNRAVKLAKEINYIGAITRFNGKK